MARILVVDDEEGLRELLSFLLQDLGHEVVEAGSIADANQVLDNSAEPFALVISDLRLPDGLGMEVLAKVRAKDSSTQVIMITAFATAENAVEAMKQGAYDYLTKPFKIEEITVVIQKALEKQALLEENSRLRSQLADSSSGKFIIGKSAVLMKTLDLARRVSRSKTSIMILGESGTGKELLARYIHQLSPRSTQSFQAVNCGAIPENLIESELFGHVKGSFTGADKDHIGLFESASGGTLFLDEVAELPLVMQVKLLRVLQEQTVRRVGEAKERPIDVRIISATNRNIKEMVEQGEFREDLYYRLNVVTINPPPLRERKDDIPLLAKAFLLKYGQVLGDDVMLSFADEALQALVRYNYPGNVRELENIIERAVALCEDSQIKVQDLPDFMRGGDGGPVETVANLPTTGMNLENYMDTIERGLLEQALEQSGGIKTHAAELLGLSFRSLRYRLKKYGFQDEE